MPASSPVLDELTIHFTTVIASVIRNAMEDFHHEHLSDDQMRQLNPIIRNAVATAMHALNHYGDQGASQRYVDYHVRSVPAYWEPPQLLEGYVKMWERDQAREPHMR